MYFIRVDYKVNMPIQGINGDIIIGIGDLNICKGELGCWKSHMIVYLVMVFLTVRESSA